MKPTTSRFELHLTATQSHAMRLRLRLLTTTLLILTACPGAKSVVDSGAPTADYYLCVADPTAVAKVTRCVADDVCPCGTHCALGVCSATCTADSECAAGQACDGFGRCVTAAHPVKATALSAKSSPVTPEALNVGAQGAITLLAVPLQLDAQHTTGDVSFDTTGAPIDSARIAATGPVEVQCDDAGGFANECLFSALTQDSRHVIHVRLTDSSASSASEVSVTTSRERLSFRVVYTKESTTLTRPLEGSYRGYAHPVAMGSVARTNVSPIPSALSDVSIPVTAVVHEEVAGKRIVELSDGFALIFPEAQTVGELLRASNGDLQLRHQARSYVHQDPGTPGEVDVAVSMESISVEKGLAGLTMMVRSRYQGVVDSANDPYVLWQLSLGWVDSVPDAGVPSLPSAYVVDDPSVRAQVRFASESAVETGLGTAFTAATPRDAATLAQVIMCTAYGAATPSLLTNVVSAPFSGDLGCTTTSPTPAQQLEVGLLKESTWQLATTLTHCISDLRADQAIESGTMAPGPGAGCIDGARTLTALGAALELDRRRGLGETVAPNAVASALAHRLLQQWLRTHVFVAKQATQVDVLNDILANESQINRGFQQQEMLDLTGTGFDVLLKPRVAIGMTHLVPAVVFNPDYRPLVQPTAVITPNPRHEETIGLPVTIVDSVQQAIGVYSALYERARYVPTSSASLEASARAFVRKSLIVVALASSLNDVTRANNPGTPTWASQWTRQQGLYGIGLAGLLRSIDNLRKGENPLGIDDQLDLPLYRVGDQTGSVSRFSAVSDYLLGTGAAPNSSAILPTRMLNAQTALDDARTSFTQNLQQDFVQATADAAQSSRLEAINRSYGGQIYSLCGDPSMNSATVLANSASIDVETCFIKPECRKTADQRRASMQPGTVATVLCTAAGVRARLGSAANTVLTTGFAPNDLAPLLNGQVTVKGQSMVGPRLNIFMSNQSFVQVDPAIFDSDLSQPVPGVLTADDLSALNTHCAALAAASETRRPTLPPETCALNGDCPGNYACIASKCVAASDSANQLACYTGAMGELTVTIRSASKDVDIARSELAELSAAYDIQMQKCVITQLGAEQQVAALAAHNRTMQKFGAIKVAADIAADLAEGLASCADTVASDNKFGIAGGIACGADAAGAAAKGVSDGMEFAMGEAERAHDLASATISAETDNAACLKEAEMELVGTKTAVLRIERAAQEVGQHLVELENRKVDLAGLIVEGHEALQSETDRTVPAIALEFWLNEKVTAYDTSFRAARRAMYLGVLAVEYEYQLSTIERQNVLAATRVADLQGVLDRLRNLVATGTVKGRVPAELHSVVSLRTNLLQLADHSSLPTGWHSLTDAQRFQLLIMSPRFAAYDAHGTYLGQQIPFAVAPLASFKLGDPGGVPLLTSGACAERVWSVNAALQGDALVQGDATRAQVTLMKRNRFFSQWCAAAPSGSASYQLAATRPSRNLFLDPFADYVPGGAGDQTTGTLDSQNEADAFVSARLEPVLNVARADFETDQYSNGSSHELAGRGLYGDYALFFPVEALARNGGDGLRLEKLTDVLLRFDYVSVAQK